MKYKQQLLLVVSIVFISTACISCNQNKRKIRQTLRAFEKTEISFPDDLICIRDGRSSIARIPKEAAILIHFVSPEECSECIISHISEESSLFELGRETGSFEYMIILSPTYENSESVINRLYHEHFPYPVFWDSNGSFNRINNIPQAPQFHTFLINESRRPVFVGNPLVNETLMKLFHDVLSTMQ